MHLSKKIFHIFCAVVLHATLVFAIASVPPSFVYADESTQEYEQVGAYSSLENAATMVESFRMEGKNAFIRQKTISGQIFYAVIIDHSTPPPLVEPGAGPVVVVEPETVMEPTGEAPEHLQGTAPEIILPTYSGMPGSTIAVHADTLLYGAPEAGAEKAGVYSSIGDGRYASTLAGFHMVWFPSVEEYGYVKAEDVRIVQYPPAEPEGDMAAAAPMAAIASASEEAQPEPAPEPQMVVEDAGPHRLIVPVTSAGKTESIEIMSDIEIYDRPFATGKPVGTYDELGGVFIKEYMGWYALRLPDGRNVFIRMEDATLVGAP